MTNLLFCYWLQGYFEISLEKNFTKSHVILIRERLNLISEPLGERVAWIERTCHYIEKNNYRMETIEYFFPLIQECLNSIFHHYINNELDIEYSLDQLHELHNGTLTHEAK